MRSGARGNLFTCSPATPSSSVDRRVRVWSSARSMAMTEKMRGLAARGGIIAATFALGIVLCAAPAAAQSGDQGGETQSYRLPGWSFTPSIGLGAIHDNNV